MWYDGTYSCGHKGRVNISGPTKDRQRKADWHFSGLCPECYEKKIIEDREKENEKAAISAVEMELPVLTGTEKQVAWANTIRVSRIEDINLRCKKIEQGLKEKGMESIPGENIGMKEITDAIEDFIQRHTDAKYWIETRDDKLVLKDIVKKYMEKVSHSDVFEEITSEKESLTVSPESCEKQGVVKIKNQHGILHAEYIRDDDFIEIVKSFGYKWNGSVWGKTITEYTGNAEDRAAELGNKLLCSGFTVQFPDKNIKEKAISADFSPENGRWVKYNEKIKKLALVWAERNNDTLYTNARKLPGSKWKDGAVLVDVEFYREVEDFAETMGFSISKKAQAEIVEYKKKECGFEEAAVEQPDKDDVTDKEKIAKALKSGGTIIEDLMDD